MGSPVTLLFQKDGFQDARLEVYLEGDGQPGGGISIFDEYVEKKRAERRTYPLRAVCFCVLLYVCARAFVCACARVRVCVCVWVCDMMCCVL